MFCPSPTRGCPHRDVLARALHFRHVFFRDVFSYSYPHARFIREMCLAGQLPYWNPTLNFGEPILANPNFLFFYPSTLLLVALPLDLGYTLHYILHFILAGIGTYALARRWNQSRMAAFFAGFVFSFSGRCFHRQSL
jgi:hypothetical protein